MKIGIITGGYSFKSCIRAAVALVSIMAAVSCSEQISDNGGDSGDFIPVTFTMSTPAGESVPYSATRVHEESEWTIHNLSLYVYAVDDSGEGTFLRSYSTAKSGDESINLVPNGAGQYTFTLRAPVNDLNAKRRFVFVANDSFADPEVGESQDELQNKVATVVVEQDNTADVLSAVDAGIAMTGIAQSASNDVVTITPGVKCEVSLRRIVARIDIQNNTPNLVIKSVALENAATKGFLFEHDPVAAPEENYVGMQKNSTVELGTTYDEQTDLKKVFYLYERTNSDLASAQVRITYTINNSNGEVVVPFRKTSDDLAYVNVERNTLYTIVLGDGNPIVTNEVKFSFVVEDWQGVDLEESVDPDEDAQAKLNATLKVNMFTPFNAKEVNLEEKKIVSFYDKLAVSAEECPTTSYFSWADLNDNGALNAIFKDNQGNSYRLPTMGELLLLFPMFTEEDQRTDIAPGTANGMYHPTWDVNYEDDDKYYQIDTKEFTETVYLKNTSDGKMDQTDHGDDENYKIEGTSQMKLGSISDIYTFREKEVHTCPVYAYRFKGTSQYAAYRWEQCRIADNPQERYLSIKIKALGKDNVDTTIDQIAQESFWKDGYIEIRLPDAGYYNDEPNDGNVEDRGFFARCWASTVNEEGWASFIGYGAGDGASSWINTTLHQYHFSLRLVRVTE